MPLDAFWRRLTQSGFVSGFGVVLTCVLTVVVAVFGEQENAGLRRAFSSLRAEFYMRGKVMAGKTDHVA